MLISASIAAELTSALVPGVTLRTLADMPTLLGLEIVDAKALSGDPADRAAAVSGLLKDAVTRVDEYRDGPTAVLLGIAKGSRGDRLTKRRDDAAELLSVNPDHFRKKLEPRRIEEVADELVALDSTYRARMKHQQQVPPAVKSRLEINWLERHEAYRRIWTPVYAQREETLALIHDVEVFGVTDHFELTDRATNVMWRRAQFTRAVDRFVEDFGGLWLLSDLEKENEAAEAIYILSNSTAGGENDDSWLRRKLAEADHGELDSFGDLVWKEDQGKEMVKLWQDWALTCGCNKQNGTTDCSVHTWIRAAGTYVQLIDEDWLKLADWYRQENETPK